MQPPSQLFVQVEMLAIQGPAAGMQHQGFPAVCRSAAARYTLGELTCSIRLVVHRHGMSVRFRTIRTARPLSLCLGFAMRQHCCLGMKASRKSEHCHEAY